jgi:hypothetical protein
MNAGIDRPAGDQVLRSRGRASVTRGANQPIAAVLIAAAVTSAGADAAWAQCSPTGTNQTCTNSAVLPNTASAAITDSGTLTLTNTANGGVGTTFSNDGIDANGANVTNAGTITGFFGIYTQGDATVANSGTINATNGVAGVLSDAGSVTATNSGTITGGEYGIAAFKNVILVNSGSVIGGSFGVFSEIGNVTVTNSGTISAAAGVAGVFSNAGTATVANSGSIAGGQYGIAALMNITLINSGSISGREVGVFSPSGLSVITNSGTIVSGDVGIASRNLMLTNAGTISGQFTGVSYENGTVVNGGVISGGQTGLQAGNGASVINSGVISSPGLALQLFGNSSTLTLLPGSTIIGGIELDGTGDTIHVNAGNQNLTFNTLAGTAIDGTAPYVVVGNRIVSLDPTQFSGSDRNLLAVIGAITGGLGSANAGPATGGALGFAGPGYVAASAEEAFADLFGYAKAPNDAVMFKNPSVAFGTGSMIWARGFLGQRVQEADGLVLRNVTNFYGGMIGVDSWFAPGLKLGALAGGGHIGTSIDLNAGSSASDLGFGGLYGRKEFGRAFVDFDILAGASANSSARTINNNLLAGGFETATANFGGWFVSPEAVAGYRFDVMPEWTLTPAARLRYLAAGFAGYTETGSTANLTVGSRLAQALEERGELTLTNTQSSDLGRFQVSATIGVIGQERVGGSTINAQILGQALAFATPGKASTAGGFVAGQLDWKTLWGATLFAGGEFSAYSDASSIITGRAGVRVGF